MIHLIQEFSNLRILKRRGIDYLDIPLFNHGNATTPQVLREAINAISDVIDWNQIPSITKVVSEEEYGGFLAACVALQRDLPFSLAKQDSIHSIDGIGIEFKMAYNNNMTLYLNGVQKGDRVVIIDDLIDTGGTMIALIQALKKSHVEIADIVALAEKVEKKGVQRIKYETGYDVKTIIRLDTSRGKVKFLSTYFDK